MYQRIKKKASESKDVILIASIVVLTVVVIRTRPRYVSDVSVTTMARELFVEFSDGSNNTYSLIP